MKPSEVIRKTQQTTLTDEDGESVELQLFPPLTQSELAVFESRLVCKLPSEIRELLLFCRGFEGGAAEHVDFTGESCLYEQAEIFPNGLPIAADGFGNFWVVDLLPSSKTWGPIYYASHDAPVILLQSPSLEDFLTELFKMSIPPHTSLVDDVHEDRLFRVWNKNPGVLSYAECQQSSDAQLRAFIEQLDPSFQVIDMRAAKIGFGFSWGRYGAKTVVKRCGDLPIFAYKNPKSLART